MLSSAPWFAPSRRRGRTVLAFAACALCAFAPPAAAQEGIEVFEAYAPRVFKVEVLEAQSSTPYVVGTAFVAAAGGYLVSNYHVINDALFHPERYRIRLQGVAGGSDGDVTVVAVEPAHDLAVLRADLPVDEPFTFATEPPPVGTRLYSLGHPRDLATAVVEGTYNGPVEHSVSPRHHFTGSVNPGMSGGPTVTEDGRVVGVNVATAGNQLSFLITAAAAAELVREALEAPRPSPDDLLAQAREKLLAFQQSFFGPILEAPLPTIELSGFAVPVGPDAFDCYTATLDDDDAAYRGIQYRCSVADHVWLSNEQWSPFATIEHVRLSAAGLNPVRFAALTSFWYASLEGWDLTDDQDVTDFACRPRSVINAAGVKLRATVCARRHDSMEDLYDVFVRTAVTGVREHTVVSTYQVSGIAVENARRLLARILEGFSWTG
jgi:hypothetical protein